MVSGRFRPTLSGCHLAYHHHPDWAVAYRGSVEGLLFRNEAYHATALSFGRIEPFVAAFLNM